MHLDHLVVQLVDRPVWRVVEPLLTGSFDGDGETYDQDVRHVRVGDTITFTSSAATSTPSASSATTAGSMPPSSIDQPKQAQTYPTGDILGPISQIAPGTGAMLVPTMAISIPY